MEKKPPLILKLAVPVFSFQLSPANGGKGKRIATRRPQPEHKIAISIDYSCFIHKKNTADAVRIIMREHTH
jgi:hypothetical protein